MEQLQNFNGGNNVNQQSFNHQSGQGRSIGYAMTDDQVEQLRKQIAAYEVITQRTLAIYLNTYRQQPVAAKIFKRWAPNRMQLDLIEKYYVHYKGRIDNEKKKEIAERLAQYGPVSEANVYNWFQNKTARDRKKQLTKRNFRSTPTCNTPNNDNLDMGVQEVGTSSRNLPHESNNNGHNNVDLISSTEPSDIGVIQAQSLPMSLHAVDSSSGFNKTIGNLEIADNFFDFEENINISSI